jgi:glycosyltransferase involved in cell wall biosynthesis
MKVFLIIPNLPENIEEIKGGIYSATINLANSLSASGINTFIITFHSEVKKPYVKIINENLRIYFDNEGDWKFHSLNFLLSVPLKLKRYIKEHKPDILHYELGGSFLFARVTNSFRNKSLLTIHGIPLAELGTIDNLPKKINYWFNGWAERFFAPRYLIHLSSFSKRFFDGIWHKKYVGTKIPNAIPDDYFLIDPLKETKNRIVTVGVIDDNKNQLLLLEALKVLHDQNKKFSLTIVGGYRDASFEILINEKVKELGLSNVVHFRGWCVQAEIAEILANSDILAVCSKHESLPMVLAEAMAASRCVIASAVGGIPEMVEDGVTGVLFESQNLDQLVEKLGSLYNNHEVVLKLAKDANLKATEVYKASSVVKRTVEFYNKILSD